jgi:glucan 1,4-alpha-glucosidase
MRRGVAISKRAVRLGAQWLGSAGLLVGVVVVVPAASTAANTPDPTSVTVAGSLQSAVGCPGDWDPTCAATHLTYDATDDVWQGTFPLPQRSYDYKAALNDSWTENYGLNAQPGGANIPLTLPSAASVKFYYDHKTHWVTDNHSSVIGVAVGSFQSKLGCAGDWDPGCLRSWLEDPDGDGVYTFQTTALPAGSYETKVAINESWDENYGQGGVPGGANIGFSVPVDGTKVTFSYLAASHVLTVTVDAPSGTPGWPGALSYFDVARKDCLGTSRTTGSKVWYTVANGVLSDVSYPTIDNTNVKTLQFVVTDGSTFTDLQERDMTSTAQVLGASGLVCRVTSTAKSGAYQLVTDYVTDPARNTVLISTKLSPAAQGRLRLYARFDATINGNGGGGSGNGGADNATTDRSTGHPIAVSYDTVTTTQAANRDYAQPVFAALDGPFSTVSSGFVGTSSDGLTQLDASHALTALYDDASNGNVVQVAQLSIGNSGKAQLALGFGSTQADAVGAAESSLATGFDQARKSYEAGWATYDSSLNPPPGALPGISADRMAQLRATYYLNANVLKASEDKTFPGAIVAGLAAPWGQAVSAGDPSNTYVGSYREVFARDLYEAWTGLMADGDRATATAATLFLFERQQQPDGSMPRNSLVNGKIAPDSFGTQLDETSYPLVMADQLGLTDPTLYEQHVKPAANFVVAHGPSFGVERWEEQSGYSPSTIAAEIAGLVAAADLADANHDAASARVWRGVADDFQRSVKAWTVTTTGPRSPTPYFLRLSKTGDPNAAISYNVGNGGPTLDQRSVIDAGFLELTRLGILAATDTDVLHSLPVVDATIEAPTPSGPGWLRYNGDGYGDRASDGRPWAPSGQGTGHVWPVLSAERAEQSLQTGDAAGAAALLNGMAQFASGVGLIPEQDWDRGPIAPSPYGTDPTVASIGFASGRPAGSAAPLTWGAGAFVRLFTDAAAGRLVDQPANTVARYVTGTPGQTTLTVTSPVDNSAVSGTVIVAGVTLPGNQVDVQATNADTTFATTSASTTAAADGSFSVVMAVGPGTTVLSIVATSPTGATAHATRTVVFDFVPGTKLLDVSDPSGDDNGPGNFAYPTSGDFKPGAYDLQDFQVYDDGTNITFRVQTRDLTPTFGSPLGAQLVDVYVHDPSAAVADTTTTASFTTRNYTIAGDSAWSRLIEVQGFGQRYVDAHRNTLGTVSIRANQVSRYITFSVPKATLGQPGAGWSFTVVLTGQDGFSSDQARSFAATPQPFQFGVCAAPSSDPHCTFDPNAVPKAVDVLTPAGVSQATELDYTRGPVVLEGVPMP